MKYILSLLLLVNLSGFAPYDNPGYSCIVVIKCKPHAPSYFGSQVAGELFKEMMYWKLGK
jgi:hypothetical protein